MTGAAEAQAKTGHDVLRVLQLGRVQRRRCARADRRCDGPAVAKNGAVDANCEYLAKAKGHWVAVPTSSGTQTKPPCARISWFKQHGLDLQAMYPVKAEHNALQDALDLGRVHRNTPSWHERTA